MKKNFTLRYLPLIVLFSALLFIAGSVLAGAITSTAAGGNWGTPGTWQGGVVPVAADDVTILNSATVSVSNAAAITVNSLTNNGTLQVTSVANSIFNITIIGTLTNSGTFNYAPSGATASVSCTIGNLINNGGAVFTTKTTSGNNNNISITGNWTNNGSYTHNTSTVTFTGTVSTINGTTQFYKLTYNKAGGKLIFDVNSVSKIDNAFTISAGGSLGNTNSLVEFTTALSSIGGAILTATFYNLQIDAAATLTTTSDIVLAGNWTNNGTFAPVSRTVTFNGSTTQSISGNTTFYNLTLANAAGGSVDFTTTTTISNQLSASSGTMTPGTSTIIFTGGAGSMIGSNAKNFYNLQINSGANITNTTPGAGNIHIANSFVNNGSFTDNSTHTFYFDQSGAAETMSGTGSAIFGNFTIGLPGILSLPTSLNTGTSDYTIAGTAFTFNRTGSSFISSGTGTVTFGNACTIQNSATTSGTTATFSNINANANVTQGIDVTVNGTLNISGSNKFIIGSNTLNLNGNILNTATGTLTGSSTSNLIIGGTAGTAYFTQTTDRVTNTLHTFTVNSGKSIALGNQLNITAGTAAGTVTVNGILNTGDNLVLNSDANGTARVGISSGTITGKSTVERYIPARKAWRFLSVPTNSTQTIKAAWQEGAAIVTDNLKPTYGTIITGNIAAWSVNGFDEFSSAGPSMKTYNSSANNYDGIASVNAPFMPSLGGYFIFIRGDRTATAFSSPVTNTTLRTTGQLFTGTQSPITINSQFIPVNNPYASPVDMTTLSTSVAYYVWDANRGGNYGYGGFTTFSWNTITGTFDVAPSNTGSYGTTNNLIDNGQAFLASKLGTPATIQFTENTKSSATLAVSPFTPAKAPGQQLRSDLYAVNADGTFYIADGVLNTWSDTYSDGIDGMDAKKNINPTENISIERDNTLLAIERRQTLRTQDTVFFQISNFRIKGTYRFVFTPKKIIESGLQPWLEDNYLNTKTALHINDTTQVNFVTDGSTRSAASDRFRIVLDAAGGPLPVTFTSAEAYFKNENIVVEWNVENETGIKYYQVEKSPDGTGFTPAVAVIAPNNQPVSSYNWLDVQPVGGYNYYRIKSIGINGEINYSKILQVFAGNRKNGIMVYPNPVADGIIHLQLNNQPAGKYGIQLINKAGQVILSKEIQAAANGSSSQAIPLESNTAHGLYRLEVSKPDGSKAHINVIF